MKPTKDRKFLSVDEKELLHKALDRFFTKVEDRLILQGNKGQRGWDGDYPAESLRHELLWDALDTFHTKRQDKLVDIAARSMFLWYQGLSKNMRKMLRLCLQ